MINVKIALVAAIAVVGAAPPALAQSFSQSFGTGNVLPFRYEPIVLQRGKVAVHDNGLNAFALEPRTVPNFSNPNDPAATGGGSLGYNEGLYNY